MELLANRERLLVVSAPSGSGKGTVIGELLKIRPNIVPSVSVTSRAPRAGEREGVHYFFVDRAEFERRIRASELAEWDEYQGNYYGTSRPFIEGATASGKDVVFDITFKGAFAIKERYPEAILVFLLPPSFAELKRRLEGRGTESEEAIRGRLAAASGEVAHMSRFDYAVVNGNALEAAKRIEAILEAERQRLRAGDAESLREKFMQGLPLHPFDDA